MLARDGGRIVFVAGAIPGERVRARVERTQRQVVWATAVEMLDASPDRRDPPSDPACGGLAYGHIAYARQRQLKGEIVVDAFRRLGQLRLDPPDVVPSPESGYRLRARLHVRDRRAGFFLEGTHALCDAAATRQLLPESIAAHSRPARPTRPARRRLRGDRRIRERHRQSAGGASRAAGGRARASKISGRSRFPLDSPA